MLKTLLIRNFAVVEELELQLKPGMTVFTGETGAGKSILVDALGLILGDRADSGIIRAGCESTEISASFELDHDTSLTKLLEEQAIENSDNELLIRRVIAKDGRSRAFVNGSAVPVNLLKSIGEHLIDIHGQHAHQSLVKRDAQRILLDDYGKHSEELQAVAAAWSEWQTLNHRINELSGQSEDYSAQLSLIRYQVDELQNLNPEENEVEKLSEDFKRLDNANRLIELVQSSLHLIKDNDNSLLDGVSTSLRNLQQANQFDSELDAPLEMLESASIQLSEAADELRHYMDKLESDPEQLRVVESRLSELHAMARKHNIPTQELSGYLQNLQQQLSDMENSEHLLQDLEKKREQSLHTYNECAAALHEKRVHSAKKISREVTKSLGTLGMGNGEFAVKVESDPQSPPNQHGQDQIDFLVSANPGQALQTLRKVASGGELSRISLAIQVISNNEKVIPTLVFDEVDAGIGGGVAEIVGKLLHSLVDKHQVFCVTHLPQVASVADNHLQVLKSSQKKSTRTYVSELDDEARIEEIARMLGGINITEQSLKHAKEMLIN